MPLGGHTVFLSGGFFSDYFYVANGEVIFMIC